MHTYISSIGISFKLSKIKYSKKIAKRAHSIFSWFFNKLNQMKIFLFNNKKKGKYVNSELLLNGRAFVWYYKASQGGTQQTYSPT